MSENIDLGNVDLSSIQIEDLQELLNNFSNINTYDFGTLDDKDTELSLEEQKIKEKLSGISNEFKFIATVLKMIEDKKTITKTFKNKEIKEYTTEEAKQGLAYLQKSFLSYDTPSTLTGEQVSDKNINQLTNKHQVHLFQKELVKKIDIKLFENGYTETHIRGFNRINGESIMTINQFQEKLSNPNTKILSATTLDDDAISYMEMSRYMRYIESIEEKEFDFSAENDSSNIQILKKYLPSHLLNNFLNEWRKQIVDYNIFKGTRLTDDSGEEEKMDIILDNLSKEEEALVVLYMKDGYSVEEIKKIIFEKNKNIREKLNENDTHLDQEAYRIMNQSEKYNNMENVSFFIKNPEAITYITDIVQLNKVINFGYNFNKLELKHLNLTLIENNPSVFLNPNITIGVDELGLIDKEFFKNNLEQLLILHPELSNDLLEKAISLNIAPKEVQDIIQRQISFEERGKISVVVIMYTEENINTNDQEKFDEYYNGLINDKYKDPFLKGIIERRLTIQILNSPEGKDYELIKLAKIGFFGFNDSFIRLLGNNIEYSKYLIGSDPELIFKIDKTTLSNPDLLNVIIQNCNANQLEYYLKYTHFSDINLFMKGLFAYTQKMGIKESNEKDIKDFFNYILLDNSFKFKLQNAFQTKEQYIDPKYVGLYKNLQEIINTDMKEFENLTNEAITNLNEKIFSSEENENQNIKKFQNELKAFLLSEEIGIENTPENIKKVDEIISLFSEDNESKKREAAIKINELLGLDRTKLKKVLTKIVTFEIEKAKNNDSQADQKILDLNNNEEELTEEQNEKLTIFNTIFDEYINNNKIQVLTEKDIDAIISLCENKGINLTTNKKLLIKQLNEKLIRKENIKKQETKLENIEEYTNYLLEPENDYTFEEHLKIQKGIEKGTINETKLDNKNNNYYFTNEECYSQTGNGFTILGKNGTPIDGLIISEDEKKLTLGNPEATENLINFYTFFKELNLLGVWKYRKELIIAVGDITINPNDDDSIKKEELRKFGNKLLTFITNIKNDGKNKKQINLNNVESVNQKLRNFSGAQSGLSDSKTFNIEGEDKFTAYLRQHGIIGGAYFHTNKFRQYL